MTAPATHWVYRAYNADGVSLYVGCTWQPQERVWQHNTDSPWRHESVRIEWDGPLPRRQALDLEHDLIWTLGPIYNRPQVGDLYDFGLCADGVTPLPGRAA